jgi:heme/copper-type cytochrome/quinol oxidase subunit 4
MQEFFNNVSRYPRYLISFTLGIFLNAIAPLMPLLKRPTTAIALVGIVIATFLFLTFTLRAMLGLSVA